MPSAEPHACHSADTCCGHCQADALSVAQRAALQRYANQHGRQWKSQLSSDWSSGRDDRREDGALLRQVRNQLGPEWLHSSKNDIRPE